MALSIKTGWGMQAAMLAVTKSLAGPVNSVLPNVGVALSITAGNAPMRLTKLSYRVDLAPDVVAGTVNVPTRWRVLVIAGTLPQDMSVYQAQAYPTGAHPEIPFVTAAQSPNPILWDLWLDFSAGDPGLNKIATEEWADAGPRVIGGDVLNCIVIPIIDANIPQVLLGAANAQIVVAASGMADIGPNGNSSTTGGSSHDQASLPRYDVGVR
jgi:hypothetical protein